MADGCWQHSSEGDLDPDLTEEAGYSGWDPPRRRAWGWGYRLLLATVLFTFVAGALLAVLR